MTDKLPEYDGPTRDYVKRKDYADDPFKAMARHYDAQVVRKGGQSIFDLKRRPVLVGGTSYWHGEGR